MNMWMFIRICMFVGLGNVNFIISYKFIEKKKNCEIKEVDDR